MADIGVFKNPDNDALMPFGGKGFVIGYVDEVNGPGAQEVSNFLPTRHELAQMAKYWAMKKLDILWFEFITGQTGSTESRLKAFARRRIARIDAALGGNDVGAAIDEVYADFRKLQDQRLWRIFMDGNEAERQAVVEETWSKLNAEPE